MDGPRWICQCVVEVNARLSFIKAWQRPPPGAQARGDRPGWPHLSVGERYWGAGFPVCCSRSPCIFPRSLVGPSATYVPVRRGAFDVSPALVAEVVVVVLVHCVELLGELSLVPLACGLRFPVPTSPVASLRVCGGVTDLYCGSGRGRESRPGGCDGGRVGGSGCEDGEACGRGDSHGGGCYCGGSSCGVAAEWLKGTAA